MAQAAWGAKLDALGAQPGEQRVKSKLGPKAGPVCVTGASGFIALHLVEQLLAKGYTVVATVRSDKNAEKMAPLLRLQTKYGRRRLRFATGVDCTQPATFDGAVKRCAGVFHTASPFTFACDDPLKELVVPAVEGTKGCLAACKKAGTVRRVVVTSSFAAIFNAGVYPWDYTYSDKDWNKASFPGEDGKFPEPAGAHGYRYSKVAAEVAAWEAAAEEGCKFDVACINPPMVIGRNYNRVKTAADLNTSSGVMRKILLGQQAPNPNSMGFVDVADVARAHIAAYEAPAAGGRRFLCTTDEVPMWTEVAQYMKDMFPQYPINVTPNPASTGKRLTLDTAALKGIGFKFTPLRTSLKVQASSLIKQGLADVPGTVWVTRFKSEEHFAEKAGAALAELGKVDVVGAGAAAGAAAAVADALKAKGHTVAGVRTSTEGARGVLHITVAK